MTGAEGVASPRPAPRPAPAPSLLHRPVLAVVALTALAVPVLFVGLDDYPVVNADEAFYHDVAWTMLETGDWWRVRTGPGEHVYDTFANAPLQYWARGLVISFVGPGLFGLRVLSALAGWLTALAAYGLARRLAGGAAGLLAGVLVLGNYQFVYLHGARTGELETGVALALVLLAGLFVRGVERPGAGFLAHHAVLAALVAWKAPVAPIPLLAEAACFLVWPASRTRLRSWLVTGLCVLPVALAWHGYQGWRLRAFLPEVLAAVGAQAGGASTVAGPLARGLWYAERAWFGAWPQIALWPAAAVVLWRRPAADGATAAGRGAARVVVVYALAVFGFYAAIAKVGPWYVSHAHPFVAIAVAVGLVEVARGGRPTPTVLGLGALGLAAIPFVAPPLVGHDPFAASAIRVPMPLAVRDPAGLPAPLAIAAVAAGLVALAWRRWTRPGAARRAIGGLAAAIVLLSAVRVLAPLPGLRRDAPVHALWQDVESRRRAGAPLPGPIEVPPVHPWVAHYYFGHAFTLRPAPARPGDPGPPHRRFLLVGERAGPMDPRPPRTPAPGAPPRRAR